MLLHLTLHIFILVQGDGCFWFGGIRVIDNNCEDNRYFAREKYVQHYIGINVSIIHPVFAFLSVKI